MEYEECESCPGYCCISTNTIHTPLTDDDILRIAKHLKVPLNEFVDRFVVRTNKVRYAYAPNAHAHFKTNSACPFLRQGLCGINSVKPQACREEKPMQLSDTISCAAWHKARVGLWVL